MAIVVEFVPRRLVPGFILTLEVAVRVVIAQDSAINMFGGGKL
jgi:hypothetical protein